MDETKDIWPLKEDAFADIFSDELNALFDDGVVRKFYLPGRRPNEISIEEWEKMVEENPNLSNTDLPIAISRLGEIVCLEKPRTALSIGIVGIRQYGKTLGMYSLADLMWWFWGMRIGFMNEGLGICFDHINKNKVPFFKNKLDILGLNPEGLPLVFCYPSTTDVSLAGVHPEFKISIPWVEFFKEPEKFCNLKESRKYLVEIDEDLKECVDMDGIREVFEMANMPKQSKMSLLGIINELAKSKIFDVDSDGHSLFKLKNSVAGVFPEQELHPLIALLKVGLMPCLITTNLKSFKYEQQVYSYYLWLIWHSKEKGGVLRDEPIMLMIDELNEVQSANKEILIKLIREGANMGTGGISMAWCAQNYTLIDTSIRTNTTMGIIFRQSHEEAQAIKKEFALTNYWADRIKSLEKMECLLVTKDHFKIYNPASGQYYTTKEPVLAELIPPLSLHRKELSSQDEYEGKKKRRIQERILRDGRWVLKDKNLNILFEHDNLNGGKEKREQTEEKLNIHPLTIYEGDDLKSVYFKKSEQPTEEISYQELIRKGLRIISAPAPVMTNENVHIRVVYILWPTETPIPKSARILQSCPSEINVLYNNEYDAVMLCGNNCYTFTDRRLSGTSDWVGFNKKWLEKYCRVVKSVLR